MVMVMKAHGDWFSPRTRYLLLLWVAFPVGTLLLGLLGIFLETWVVALVLFWTFLIGSALQNSKCPNCGTRIRSSFWGTRVSRICRGCHSRLDENRREAQAGDRDGGAE